MQLTTLCFLVKDNKILLAMKKRGFGVGKINGIGGKLNIGEKVTEAAAREVSEEIGVKVDPDKLIDVGSIKFFFNDNPDWHQHVHIFLINDWQGEPQESEEMKPAWYFHDAIPFHQMWADDPNWLPLVLSGKRVSGSFYFNNKGAEIEKFEVREI